MAIARSHHRSDPAGRERPGSHPAPGRLYGRATLAFRRGLIGLETIAELLQRPDRDQLRQELEDAGLAPDDVGLDAADPTALDEALEDQAILAAGRRPGRVSRDRFASPT
jgi:hypothetical protein